MRNAGSRPSHFVSRLIPGLPVTRHSPHATRHPEKGVALVITLILLAVITFMAITFLVVSTAEKGSVTTQTDLSIARLAADAGRDRAIADFLAPILASNNPYTNGPLASVNYIKEAGFDPGSSLLDNVNYDYTTAGTPLTASDALQNLANLFYNPRPPVFVVTNPNPPLGLRSNEFRFYVDLNRNGAFDRTGLLPLTNNAGQRITDQSGGVISDTLVGDPQWLGILQHPEMRHSPDNLFSSRYAYFVVPAGQALDINAIHNAARFSRRPSPPGMDRAPDGFVRNQGILPSEINLAAFLVDLNTNLWPIQLSPFGFVNSYWYVTNLGLPNSGDAFANATGCLAYRYNKNYQSLANISDLFEGRGDSAFSAMSMDAYAAGPLMTGTWWPFPATNQARVVAKYPWSGSYSPNAFSSPQDFFDESKTAANLRPVDLASSYSLTRRLKLAGSQTNSYDRYTFYRLLSQLGTDSAPEPENKLNLNYCNVNSNGYVVPNAATGFTNWQPVQFFTNLAIRLLVDAGYTVGDRLYATNLLVTDTIGGVLVTNLHIPISPTNLYTPSVQRLLQVAANAYDASINRTNSLGYPLPTVFRPLFSELPRSGNSPRRVFIVNYRELNSRDLIPRNNPFTGEMTNNPPHDFSDLNDTFVQPGSMVYNVPLVIGARKGLPNFDQMTMDTQIQVARKLIFHRNGTSTTAPVNEIDPVYLLTITNVMGLQAWNSYAVNSTRPLRMQVWPDVSIFVTNLASTTSRYLNQNHRPMVPTNIPPITFWGGYNPTYPQNSFITPLGSPTMPYVFMPTNSVYSFYNDKFVVNGPVDRTPGQTNYNIPLFKVIIKARLRYALLDITNPNEPELVDYVNLAANKEVDLTDALMQSTDGGSACGTTYSQVYRPGSMWCTNRAGGPGVDPNLTFGIRQQIDASKGSMPNADWNSSLPDPIFGSDRNKAIARFQDQFDLGLGVYPKVNTFAAPFQPFRNIRVVTLWQANDPLVHYTVSDLKNTKDFSKDYYLDRLPSGTDLPPTPYRGVNSRFEPWGGNPISGSASATKYDWRVKDSVARAFASSDDWDFPANKLPHIGWLGRVHRGTPWQTIYLKSPDVPFGIWTNWTGNWEMVTNFGQFSTNMILPPEAVYFPRVTAPVPFTNGVVAYDGYFSQPRNDSRVLDLFTTAIDAGATRGRLSINQTNLAAWSAVLSGVIVLSNNVDAAGNGILIPVPIEPAGANDDAGVARLVRAINATRADPKRFPTAAFQRLGDLLTVPELTATYPQTYVGSYPNGYWAQVSPFLNLGNPNAKGVDGLTPEQRSGLSDATLERIPQQILGLLKCDQTPRVVIYAYGQTLKPAPRSRVTSGPYFGMVTNYQITAEVATRTVVRFDGVQPYQQGLPPLINNLHPVIESFSVLPPE